mmetsp:Transcript_35830/g.83367  ORF Transcript_35830/g.83367 Transcript_35830/m.83367 type:complete len:364 (-) Transcript_35830:48-1139(-)
MAASSLAVFLASAGTCIAMRTSTGVATAAQGISDTNATSLVNAKVKLLHNQYILDWFDPFGTDIIAKDIERRKWEFVVPVLCRKKGLWLKVNKLMKERPGHHCVTVTCAISGSITAEPLLECPYGDIFRRTQDNMPDRLFDTNRANVVSRDLVWKTPMSGLPPAKGVDGSIMSLNALPETDRGWEFLNVARLQLARSQFVAWPGPAPFCQEASRKWKQYDLSPEDEGALAACQSRAEEEREQCSEKWNQRIGVQTAWMWKELGNPTGPDAKAAFPGCTAWCEEVRCDVALAPQELRRDKKAIISLFNSHKYTCEQELDKYAAKTLRRCTGEGSFCFEPWAELEPCAEFLALPQEPPTPQASRM